METLGKISLYAKVWMGEELTLEEKEEYSRLEKLSANRPETNLALKFKMDEANKQSAIESQMSKYCPSIKRACIGPKCAMFILHERAPIPFEEKSCLRYYTAKCGYNKHPR